MRRKKKKEEKKKEEKKKEEKKKEEKKKEKYLFILASKVESGLALIRFISKPS